MSNNLLGLGLSLLALAGVALLATAQRAELWLFGQGLLVAAAAGLLALIGSWLLAGTTAAVGGFTVSAAARWLRVRPDAHRPTATENRPIGMFVLSGLVGATLLAGLLILSDPVRKGGQAPYDLRFHEGDTASVGSQSPFSDRRSEHNRSPSPSLAAPAELRRPLEATIAIASLGVLAAGFAIACVVRSVREERRP